eukprot:g5808.t1
MASEDRDVLKALFRSTGGESWEKTENWATDADLSTWHGVVVDVHGRVRCLDLNNNRVRGPIPEALGALSNLTALYLTNNQLTGPIPEALGALSNLTALDLGGNQLTGPIPEALGALSNLTALYLRNNQLTGTVPLSIWKLPRTKKVDLDDNLLTHLFGPLETSAAQRVVLECMERLDLARRDQEYIFGLHTKGNPWEFPPAAVVANGPICIRKYCDTWEQCDFSLAKIYALKVVFVGAYGAGKTSLARSIKMGRGDRTPEVDENARTTVGVDLHNHKLGNGTECKIYDVAGQITYYGLHQFFLTERAVYVVVWDATKFEGLSGEDLDQVIEDNILEWVYLLHLRTPLCTVMLVASHFDELGGATLEENKQLLVDVEGRFLHLHQEWKALRDDQNSNTDTRMTILPGVFPVGCKLESESASYASEDGLQAIDGALSKQTAVVSCVPPSWVAARDVLEQIGSTHDGSSGATTAEDDRRRPWELRSAIHTKFKSYVEEGRRNASQAGVQQHPASHLSRVSEDGIRHSMDGAIELRAFSGTVISHDDFVVLDVMWLAGVLKPILDHRGVMEDKKGRQVFADRELGTASLEVWADELVHDGILRRGFARFLWSLKEQATEGADDPHEMEPAKFEEILEEIGVTIPLPETPSITSIDEGAESKSTGDGNSGSCVDGVDLLVIMRLPLVADEKSRKELARQVALNGCDDIDGKSSLKAVFKFDHAGAPHGLPERVMALSHKIGVFSPEARWRLGGLFLLHDSGTGNGETSSMILEYEKKSKSFGIEALGQSPTHMEAMQFVISALFQVARGFPGAGWKGWMECGMRHDGQKMYRLAASKEKQQQSPGSWIIPPIRDSLSGTLSKQRNLCRRRGLKPRGSCAIDPDLFGRVLDVKQPYPPQQDGGFCVQLQQVVVFERADPELRLRLSPGSRQHAFVAAAVVRGRVRQRESSSALQQAPAAAASWQLLTATTGYDGDANGAATIRERLTAGSVRVGGRNSNDGSGDNEVYTSRNRMMAAAKRRRWTDVLDILDHWEKRASRLDAKTYNVALSALGKCGRWKEALATLDRMRAKGRASRLDAKTYNVALSALGKCGRWKEALATLDRMRAKGVPPDVYSFNSAISACGRAAKWQQALALLSEMEREGSMVAPDLFSFNGAINAVAKGGRWQQALDLLMGIKTRGMTPDVVSFSSAMSACDRAGEWQRALEIMDLMLEQNVEPNIVSYGTAISACARGGRWQKALSLLADIPSRGLELNAHVYGSAIHACAVGGEHHRALALLGEMLERRVIPDAAAFTAAMAAADGWAAALRLLEIMKREGVLPDIKTYNAAMSVIARSGREDVALALLNQMRVDGCSPDVVSFNTAIDACASRERWQEAVELLEVDMPGAKVKPDVITITSVIHACAGPTGNWEKAYELLDTMWQDPTGPRPNKLTYDLVIQACGHGGEWELGVALIDDMRDLDIAPDAQTFNIAVAACARSGERLAAETLVANMWKARVTPDEFTYASLVAACGNAKEWKRATEIFDEARYVHRLRPSLQIYGALLGALADGKRWAEVLTYLDRMVADGLVPDATAINTAVLAAAELGDGRRALSLLEGDVGGKGGGGDELKHQQRRLKRVIEGGGDGSSVDTLPRNQRSGRGEAASRVDRNGEKEEEEEALLDGAVRLRAERPRPNEGGEGGALPVGAVLEEQFFSLGGGVAAATKASRTADTPSRVAEAPDGRGVGSTGGAEAGGTGGGGDGGLAGGVVRGGWETATPSLLNSVLHALDEAGEDAAVLRSVKRGREMGVLLTPSIYRCALKACGNEGDYGQANDLLARMSEESLTPDIVHWNHALRASAACARWQEARLRLQEMQTLDTPPDEFSYSMALKACSAGLWSGDRWSDENGWGAKEECGGSLRRTRKVGAEGQQEGGGAQQEHKVSQTCRGKHAIELLQEMKDNGVRLSAQSFTLAMAACLEAHRDRSAEAGARHIKGQPPATDLRLSRAALSLFARLVEAGETPTGTTYALALKACARTADPRRAHSLFWAMLDSPARQHQQQGPLSQPQPRPEVRPWHLASAVAAFDAAGDWTGAQELWGEALRRGVSPRSPGYDAMVAAAVRAGDTAGARGLVQEALGLGLGLSWNVDDVRL